MSLDCLLPIFAIYNWHLPEIKFSSLATVSTLSRKHSLHVIHSLSIARILMLFNLNSHFENDCSSFSCEQE